MNGREIAETIRHATGDLMRRYPSANNGDPGKSILVALETLAKTFEEAHDALGAKEEKPETGG
jgi:hypothetical protein